MTEKLNRWHASMREGLARLHEQIRTTGIPFNALLTPGGSDVPVLALPDNGEGWEACYDPSRKTYDLWKDGRLVEPNLTLQQAANRMVEEYANAKAERVVNRYMAANPSANRARIAAEVAIAVREPIRKQS